MFNVEIKTNKKRFVKKFGHGRVNRDFAGIRTKPIFSHKRIPKKNSRLTASECCLWLTFYCSIWDDQKTAINIAVRASVILFLCFYVKVCVGVRMCEGECAFFCKRLHEHPFNKKLKLESKYSWFWVSKLILLLLAYCNFLTDPRFHEIKVA